MRLLEITRIIYRARKSTYNNVVLLKCLKI